MLLHSGPVLTTRRCTKCSEEKDKSEFYVGRGRICKACQRKRVKDHYFRNLDKKKAYFKDYRQRHRGLRYRVDFDALWVAQDGKCAACGGAMLKSGSSGDAAVIDHDHSCCTGRRNSCGKCVRGLLHRGCNVGIGNFLENPQAMRDAADYLERWEARKV